MSGLVDNVSSHPGTTDSSLSEHHAMSQVKNRAEEAHKGEQASRDAAENTVRAIEDYVETHRNSLKIQVHKGTGQIMVKVISKDGKTIREIPSEELLNLAAKLENFEGMLFNESV